MRIGEICNREVVVIKEDSSVTEAARIMREYHVGDVVIVREQYGQQLPVGILTDRDIALGVVADEIDPKSVSVGDAMSFELTTVSEDEDFIHAIEVMRDKGIRRIPVVDADEVLIGILTVDDVLDLLSGVLIDLVHLVDGQRRREIKERP
jgi:CBS domain-containing protein